MKLRNPTILDIVLGIVFLTLNIADAWITLKALHKFPGIVYEANPIMALAIEQGEGFFWFVKVGISVLISIITSVTVIPKRAAAFLVIGSIIVGLAVLSNIVHYLYAISPI